MLLLNSLTTTCLKFMNAFEFCQAWLSCQKNLWYLKKTKTLQVCMRTGIWPEILWNSLLFCLWKALEAPSVSSRLSLYFFVCLSPHACVYSDSLPSLGWWREPCLCGHRCVNVHCLVISGYHNQYSETVSAGRANILLIFKLGLAKTCMWNTFFPL